MKAKKKSFGIQLISILVVVAIISVGFAAWIITSPIAGDSVQGGFIAQDYIDNTFTISIDLDSDDDGKNESLIFGKPDEVEPANTNSKAFFESNDSYKFNWFSFETTGNDVTPDEVRTVVFTVTIDPTDDTNEKTLENLLLDRSVMISLTLNNAQQRWVDGGDADDHFEEVKKDNEGNYVTDSESTAAYALYSKAHDLTLSKPIDTKQVDLFTNDELIAEPKMQSASGTGVAKSEYTHNIYKELEVPGYTTTNDVWSDANAISIVLEKEQFVAGANNTYVATVNLSIDWGTYFNIYYASESDYTIVKEPITDESEGELTPCISNVNPYYFFNLQNIYKDGNNWIEEAKEAIDTIFALNYTAANDKTVGNVSGSGVQYQLSIHPIPYVDVNK